MTQGPLLIFYLLVLILPITALVAGRPSARQWLPMALAWLAIFTIGWLAFSYFT